MPIGPHSIYGHKRSAARYRPGRADDAFVEFDSNEGPHRKFCVAEISATGVCFGLDQSPRVLFAGATIEMATISAGGLRIAGRLRAVHVTSGFASGTICGAEFFPRTQEDERALAQLISRFEKRGLRSG